MVITPGRLRILSFVLCGFHVAGILVVMMTTNVGMLVTLYDSVRSSSGSLIYVPRSPSPLVWPFLVFIGGSAFTHLGNAYLWNGFYVRELSLKRNPIRWIEYGLTGSMLATLLAIFAGTRGFIQLLYVYGLVAATMPFGWFADVISRPHPDTDEWTRSVWVRAQPQIIGYIPLVVAWAPVLHTFVAATWSSPCPPPPHVHATIVTQAVALVGFPILQLYQLFSPPSRYIWGEFWYIILSFSVKTYLGVVTLASILVYDSIDRAVIESFCLM